MTHNRREISAWCSHKEKEKNSKQTQFDKASVNKERQQDPNPGNPQLQRGGGGSDA